MFGFAVAILFFLRNPLPACGRTPPYQKGGALCAGKDEELLNFF